MIQGRAMSVSSLTAPSQWNVSAVKMQPTRQGRQHAAGQNTAQPAVEFFLLLIPPSLRNHFLSFRAPQSSLRLSRNHTVMPRSGTVAGDMASLMPSPIARNITLDTLPAEIRMKIFAYLFSAFTIHPARYEKRNETSTYTNIRRICALFYAEAEHVFYKNATF